MVASLVFTLLLLGVLLSLTIKWRCDRINGFEDQEQKTCDTCNEMMLRTNVEYCEAEQDGRCCCKTSYMIKSLVQMNAAAKFRNYRLHYTAAVIKSNCTYSEKASGHVIGIDTHKLAEASQKDKELVYFKAQTINSIQHSNGRFSVNETGLYYVFCQIKFEHDPESTIDPASRQSHTLHKYSSNTRHETKLLEKTRSFSELRGPENNGTSFIGAVYDLEKDDHIMVKSSHTNRLVGDGRDNFFGIYII